MMIETMYNITFGYVMSFLLVSELHDAKSVINGTMPFVSLR